MKESPIITKKELALRWGITTECLRLWLQDCDCRKELEEAGYKKNQKYFTPKQLEIIRRHFE